MKKHLVLNRFPEYKRANCFFYMVDGDFLDDHDDMMMMRRMAILMVTSSSGVEMVEFGCRVSVIKMRPCVRGFYGF